LLCHYQIKASLLGRELPFAASSLETAALRVEDMTKRHKAVEQDTVNHFLALYLDRYPQQSYRAEVLAVLKDGAILVAIPSIGIERTATLNGTVHPGQARTVKAVVERSRNTVTWVEA
jgi:exoribonuclease R